MYNKKNRPEYNNWKAMITRCYNPNADSYPKYGGSGITVCERWRGSFENFFNDMGEKPSPRHSIDRYPNQSGNYEPGNCRWATPLEQSANRRDNQILEYDGKRMNVFEWSRQLGVHPGSIDWRIKRGWDVKRIITEPYDKRPKIGFDFEVKGLYMQGIKGTAIAKILGINYHTACTKIRKLRKENRVP